MANKYQKKNWFNSVPVASLLQLKLWPKTKNNRFVVQVLVVPNPPTTLAHHHHHHLFWNSFFYKIIEPNCLGQVCSCFHQYFLFNWFIGQVFFIPKHSSKFWLFVSGICFFLWTREFLLESFSSICFFNLTSLCKIVSSWKCLC